MAMINGYDVTVAPIILDGHLWFFIKNKRGEERAFIDVDVRSHVDRGQPGLVWFKGQPWDDDKTEDMIRELTKLHVLWVARTTGRTGEIGVEMTYHPDAELVPDMPDDLPYLGRL